MWKMEEYSGINVDALLAAESLERLVNVISEDELLKLLVAHVAATRRIRGYRGKPNRRMYTCRWSSSY